MQKNYLILAHKNSHQVKRLIHVLEDGASRFIIHLDASANLEDFKNEIGSDGNIFWIERRIDCIWGDFSIVQATINGLDFIVNSQLEGYTILMSGQDYPIKSKLYINNYLEQNQAYNHISIHRNPVSKEEPIFYKRRLTHYNFFLSKRRGDAVSLPYFWSQSLKEKIKTMVYLSKNYKKADFLRIFTQKSYPYTDFYQGHQWFGFNYETILKVHHAIKEKEKELFSFFKYVTVPDEFFFHTILKNLQQKDKNILIKNSLTVNLPFNHDETHLEGLLNELPHKLFARKFDEEHNIKIFDLLDEYFTVSKK